MTKIRFDNGSTVTITDSVVQAPSPTLTALLDTLAAPAAAPAASSVDLAGVLDKLAAKNPEKLDWKRSIADLMKLVGMDSSLCARKELAQDLHYSGDMNDSAAMNMWLHEEVMRQLAANGAKVPQDLLKKLEPQLAESPRGASSSYVGRSPAPTGGFRNSSPGRPFKIIVVRNKLVNVVII